MLGRMTPVKKNLTRSWAEGRPDDKRNGVLSDEEVEVVDSGVGAAMKLLAYSQYGQVYGKLMVLPILVSVASSLSRPTAK
jgi:hypothetical protein